LLIFASNSLPGAVAFLFGLLDCCFVLWLAWFPRHNQLLNFSPSQDTLKPSLRPDPAQT
jgi:hypothetical protein